jgi:hypothetical protein
MTRIVNLVTALACAAWAVQAAAAAEEWKAIPQPKITGSLDMSKLSGTGCRHARKTAFPGRSYRSRTAYPLGQRTATSFVGRSNAPSYVVSNAALPGRLAQVRQKTAHFLIAAGRVVVYNFGRRTARVRRTQFHCVYRASCLSERSANASCVGGRSETASYLPAATTQESAPCRVMQPS